MLTWKAYLQINGYDFSRYPVVEFPVPDDLHTEILRAVAEGRPLRDCPFHAELTRLAVKSVNLGDYRPDYADLFPDLANVVIASCVIDDPGDLPRLEARIRGLRLLSPEVTVDNDDCTRRYWIIVALDDDERIESVVDVHAEGVSGESDRSASTELCYPDYDYIADELKRIAGEES